MDKNQRTFEQVANLPKAMSVTDGKKSFIIGISQDHQPLFYASNPHHRPSLLQVREAVGKQMEELERQLSLLTEWRFLAGAELRERGEL